MNTVIDTLIEVELSHPENFLKIVETLTRIGLLSKDKKRLTQTAHLLQKRGSYYICHFKQLFQLDGRDTTLDEEDLDRVKRIANLLEDWDLCSIIKEQYIIEDDFDLSDLKIVKHSDKKNYELIAKYKIGRK